jgi:hypothetical protein
VLGVWVVGCCGAGRAGWQGGWAGATRAVSDVPVYLPQDDRLPRPHQDGEAPDPVRECEEAIHHLEHHRRQHLASRQSRLGLRNLLIDWPSSTSFLLCVCVWPEALQCSLVFLMGSFLR